LKLIQATYEKGEYIAYAKQSTDNAHAKLGTMAGFPAQIGGASLFALLEEAERGGLIVKEQYTTQRRDKLRWCVTDKGREEAAKAW